MKRISGIVAVLLLLMLLLPIHATANSAPYYNAGYKFLLEELPNEAAYVDLLIQLDETDEFYVPLNKSNLPDGMAEDAQIVSYCEDGFRSYSLHYKNAFSYIRVAIGNSVRFALDDNDSVIYGSIPDRLDELIDEEGSIRLAILDKEGNIIQISKEFTLVHKQIFRRISGDFTYNARTDTFTAEESSLPFEVAVYIVFALIGMVFTVITEYLVSIPFGLWKDEGKTIVLTNIISQMAMHLLYILLYGVLFWQYIQAVLLLEILIYAGEYMFYRCAFWPPNRKKALVFTLTANTVSLLVSIAAMAYVGIHF